MLQSLTERQCACSGQRAASIGRTPGFLPGLSFVTVLAFTVGRYPELAAEPRSVKADKSLDKVLVGITGMT